MQARRSASDADDLELIFGGDKQSSVGTLTTARSEAEPLRTAGFRPAIAA